jgi:hypothetical protein
MNVIVVADNMSGVSVIAQHNKIMLEEVNIKSEKVRTIYIRQVI